MTVDKIGLDETGVDELGIVLKLLVTEYIKKVHVVIQGFHGNLRYVIVPTW